MLYGVVSDKRKREHAASAESVGYGIAAGFASQVGGSASTTFRVLDDRADWSKEDTEAYARILMRGYPRLAEASAMTAVRSCPSP